MKVFRYVSDNRYKIFKTLLTYVTFAGLGGVSTLLGSSLLDLQIRVQKSFEVTSSLVPTRATGYIVGASVAGLFEKIADDNLVLSLSNLVAGIFMIAAPWFYEFMFIAACIFLSSLGQGVFDIYCNTIILRIWGKNGTNWLQVLHMFFGVGSLLAPVITRPFLLPMVRDEDEPLEKIKVNSTLINGYAPEDVMIQYPFVIVGGILCMVSIPYFFCYLNERNEKKAQEEDEIAPMGADISPVKKYGAVVITAIAANIAFGTEVLVGTLGPAFSVKSDLKMSKQTGVLLTTVYWSMFSFYRLIFIPLTMIFKEERLVQWNILILLASVFVMVPNAAYKQIYAWISFTLLGIGFSPLFAVAFGSLSNYFEVTSKMTSFIFVNGVIGESLHTTIAALFMDETPQVYVYYLGSLSLVYAVLCFGLPIYCKKMLKSNNPTGQIPARRTISIRSH